MSYKTVLVHVDESEHASERIKLAAGIAMAEHAHLIGTAMTGASRYLVQTQMLAERYPNLKTHLDFLRERALRGLEEFDITAQRIGKVLQQDPAIATGAGHHSVFHVAKDDTWYIVYHRRPLGDTQANHRETAIDRMVFDKDGRILPVKITNEGVQAHPLR